MHNVGERGKNRKSRTAISPSRKQSSRTFFSLDRFRSPFQDQYYIISKMKAGAGTPHSLIVHTGPISLVTVQCQGDPVAPEFSLRRGDSNFVKPAIIPLYSLQEIKETFNE